MQKTIDILLKALEKRADELHIDIDNREDYRKICVLVTAFEFGDPITYDDKLYIRDTLRDVLFPLVRLDYRAMFISLIGTAPL